ncbi:MAG: hypothetical protein JWQ21_3738 [Herminiimonas sp.]|nr:hypothetical protein [Herminiimonas sp.]
MRCRKRGVGLSAARIIRIGNKKKPPQLGAVRFSFDTPRFTNSIAVRVVRVAVSTIGHAIAVTITIAAISVCVAVVMAFAGLPSAAVQTPAIIALLPFRTLIILAGAYAFPMTSGPHMLSAIPIPITRRPFISPARGWHDFISWRGRCVTNNDIETHLRDRLSRDKSSSTENNCCGSTDNAFHINLQMNLCSTQYIELPKPCNKGCICLQDIYPRRDVLYGSEQTAKRAVSLFSGLAAWNVGRRCGC